MMESRRLHNQGQALPRPIRPSPTSSSGQKTKVRQIWTPEEDRILSRAVAKETPQHGAISWHKVAAHLPGRNNKDCRKRWHYSVSHTIKKGTWTKEEDEKLLKAVDKYGARWSKVATVVGSRNGDQCWKRWYDCLDPRIDKSPWTAEEDAKLLQEVASTGRNWSEIVTRNFPNRTSLSAKNRYSILQRRQCNAADVWAAGYMEESTESTATTAGPANHSEPAKVSHLSPATGFLGPPGLSDPSNSAGFLPHTYPIMSDNWYSEDQPSEISTPAFSPDLGWARWSPCPSTLALSSSPQGFVNAAGGFNTPMYPSPSISSANLFASAFDSGEIFVPCDIGYTEVAPPLIQVCPPVQTSQTASQGYELAFPMSWGS